MPGTKVVTHFLNFNTNHVERLKGKENVENTFHAPKEPGVVHSDINVTRAPIWIFF
jgi:hypothetical protein